jgi:hypothetical protein
MMQPLPSYPHYPKGGVMHWYPTPEKEQDAKSWRSPSIVWIGEEIPIKEWK